MDVFTFMDSAAALYPYFESCARTGRETAAQPAPETFKALRPLGCEAEGEMLEATGGVNTHKGAIFSLGILCGALGRLDRGEWGNPDKVLDICAQMTAGLLQQDFGGLKPGPGETVGQKLYLDLGITGVRGQAAAGFPEAKNIGLPKLEAGLQRGLSLNDAACAALMALIADTVDTNMIHRGGVEAQRQVSAAIGAELKDRPFPEKKALDEWNDRFVERNLSPGGCADLLAMTLMLHFLKEDTHE